MTPQRTIPALPQRLIGLCQGQGWVDALTVAVFLSMVASAWLVPAARLTDVASWGLVIYGSAMAAVILIGTLSTAQDGQPLGKSWASIWIPLRTAVSTSLLLPVITIPEGAISPIQMLGLSLRHLLG